MGDDIGLGNFFPFHLCQRSQLSARARLVTFVGDYCDVRESRRGQMNPSLAQLTSQSSVLRRVGQLPYNESLYTRHGAFNELMPTVIDYAGVDQATAVRPYQRSLVSIPVAGASPVPLSAACGRPERTLLERSDEFMLSDPDDVGWQMESGTPQQLYMDEVLRKDRSAYVGFIADVLGAGLVDFSVTPKEICTPFFVEKKNKNLRLILDCRWSNLHFRPAPSLDMGTGAAWARVERPAGDHDLYFAGADVKDYFHSLENSAELKDYFCHPSLTLEEFERGFVDWPGAEEVLSMARRSGLREVWPRAVTVPMGWSWAFFLGQKVLENQISVALQGRPHGQLRDAGPLPDILGGVGVLPYCDNLNVYGVSREEVQQAKNLVVGQLRRVGFRLDGARWLAMNKPERAARLQRACRNLEGCRRVTGHMVRRWLGHVVDHFLIMREGLSCLRSCYDFVEKVGGQWAEPWASVRKEARWVRVLTYLCAAELPREWHPEVLCTDACESGIGVASRVIPVQEVAKIGCISERWDLDTVIPMGPGGELEMLEGNNNFQEGAAGAPPGAGRRSRPALALTQRSQGAGPAVHRGLRRAQPPARPASQVATRRATTLPRNTARPLVSGETREERREKRARVLPPFQPRETSDQLSMLESHAVTERTLALYESWWKDLQDFVQSMGAYTLDTVQNADSAMVDFADFLFMEGFEVADIWKAYAAVVWHLVDLSPWCRLRLPRFARAMRGARHLDPGLGRIACVAWITMFTAYLRPADLHALRGEDLAAPAGSSQWWALNLHPAGRGDESKVGLSDESLLLDAPYLPGLGAALAALATDREGEKLFDISPAELLRLWNLALVGIGLPARQRYVQYQLRHGGPSHDRLTKTRSVKEVWRRGRWASAKSVKRYEASARVQQEMQRLPAAVRAYVERALVEAGRALVPGGVLAVEGLNDMHGRPEVQEAFHRFVQGEAAGPDGVPGGGRRWCPFLRIGTVVLLSRPPHADAYRESSTRSTRSACTAAACSSRVPSRSPRARCGPSTRARRCRARRPCGRWWRSSRRGGPRLHRGGSAAA
ncbi:unnamed protein product [Prorocentrum cordatum]|uniref:Uncharacterized protein n=1 Tax=Prorocentrum cordatum TaxID=2364126 RepID=A0ABN9WIR1_9DINO|nr:unnamed protein product [Polarella glacialis]